MFAGRPTPPVTTGWDVRCGFADSDETMRTRVREDIAAFAGTPAVTVHLAAIEGAYVRSRDARRADLAALTGLLTEWLDTHPTARVLLPAGAGNRTPPPPWHALRRWLPTRPASAALAPPSAAAIPGSSHECSDEAHPITGDATVDGPGGPGGFGRLVRTRATRPLRALGAGATHLARRAMHAEYVRRRRRANPAGSLAQNPDHLELRDHVLASLQDRPDVEVVLYEELPYLWHQGADEAVRELASSTGLAAQEFHRPVDVARKAAHLRHYESQLLVMDPPGRLTRAAHLPPQERYWLLTRPSSPSAS